MEKIHYFDHQPDTPSKSIEDMKSEHEHLLITAETQLEIIQPALQVLIETIESIKPDVVVFLDKGARLLGTPVMKVLRDRKTDESWLPHLDFFNDQNLKDNLMQPVIPLSQYTEGTFFGYRHKRVLFVDETTSSGIAATALLEKAAAEAVDGYYFALTVDDTAIDNRQATIDKLALFQDLPEVEAAHFYDELQVRY